MPLQVVEALQQAGVRCKLNVALDGPVVVDVALTQRQVGVAIHAQVCSTIHTTSSTHLLCSTHCRRCSVELVHCATL